MASYFTVGTMMSVICEELDASMDGRATVQVVIPADSPGNQVIVTRPFPTWDDAQAAGKAIADQLNRIESRGFTRLRRNYKPADVAARNRMEALLRDWAGPEAKIVDTTDV